MSIELMPSMKSCGITRDDRVIVQLSWSLITSQQLGRLKGSTELHIEVMIFIRLTCSTFPRCLEGEIYINQGNYNLINTSVK